MKKVKRTRTWILFKGSSKKIADRAVWSDAFAVIQLVATGKPFKCRIIIVEDK